MITLEGKEIDYDAVDLVMQFFGGDLYPYEEFVPDTPEEVWDDRALLEYG